MKIAALIVAFVVGIVLQAQAMKLIVTKKGQGVWATTARRVDKRVVYISKDTGEESFFPVTELDGVIPKVRRGKQYKPDEIQKYIDRIKSLRTKHFRLLRQLNPLLQEWESLQKPSPELEGEIDAQAATFKASDKGPTAFEKASLALEMVKYKDLAGKYTEQIDQVAKDMRKECLEVNMPRFARFAQDSPKDRIGVFVKARLLGGQLTRIATDGAQKAQISKMVADARKRTFDTNVKMAYSTFMNVKTIDAYLRSAQVLDSLKKEVADTEADKSGLDRQMSSLVELITKKEPTYDFSRDGFPMGREDKAMLRNAGAYTSRVTFDTTSVELECYVLPAASPKRIRFGQPFTVPLRLIFRRAQPKDRELVVVVMLRTQRGMHRHAIPLKNVQIRNGRADVVFREGFTQLEDGFVPVREPRQGGVTYYVYMGYAQGDNEWQAISRACAWPTVY
ncbi:MAG: hypothetical protein HQ559_17400 [Lentisphaerae bacterium]|nr:hypothetical protein [Lentisphaerota bacterium]